MTAPFALAESTDAIESDLNPQLKSDRLLEQIPIKYEHIQRF